MGGEFFVSSCFESLLSASGSLIYLFGGWGTLKY